MFQDTFSSSADHLDRPMAVESHQVSARPRFSLRKRVVRNDGDAVNLSSYNSDFLTGLFADVAKANVLTELEIPHKRRSELISNDDHADTPFAPSKKSRTALTRCLSRVPPSSMNLSDLAEQKSPKGINEFFGSSCRKVTTVTKKLQQSSHHESLAFQLNCVSGTDESGASPEDTSAQVADLPRLAFPNLPATVSDSSCDKGLTRAKLVRHVSSRENDTKDSFGWFVDLDDHQSPEPQVGLPDVVSSDDLAFQAPTAPKRVNNDAEVEWAKAADTVDDVLGDFF